MTELEALTKSNKRNAIKIFLFLPKKENLQSQIKDYSRLERVT